MKVLGLFFEAEADARCTGIVGRGTTMGAALPVELGVFGLKLDGFPQLGPSKPACLSQLSATSIIPSRKSV
jgi:hypothetical protein